MVTAGLVDRFIAGAVAAGAEVFRAPDARAALAAAARLFKEGNIDRVVAPPALRREAEGAGLALAAAAGTAAIAAAQAALVRADYGAAETGTLVRLDPGDDEKLAWTLPPLCVCLLDGARVAADLQSLAGVISDHLGRSGVPGPQVSFITGPSRTADIECRLTIGVQGPARLVIGLIEGEGP